MSAGPSHHPLSHETPAAWSLSFLMPAGCSRRRVGRCGRASAHVVFAGCRPRCHRSERLVLTWNNCELLLEHEGVGVYGGRDALHCTSPSRMTTVALGTAFERSISVIGATTPPPLRGIVARSIRWQPATSRGRLWSIPTGSLPPRLDRIFTTASPSGACIRTSVRRSAGGLPATLDPHGVIIRRARGARLFLRSGGALACFWRVIIPRMIYSRRHASPHRPLCRKF